MSLVQPVGAPDYMHSESFAAQVIGPELLAQAIDPNTENTVTYDGRYFTSGVAWVLASDSVLELAVSALGPGGVELGVEYHEILTGVASIYLPTQHFGYGFTIRVRNLDNTPGTYDLTAYNNHKVLYPLLTPPRTTHAETVSGIPPAGIWTTQAVAQGSSYDDVVGIVQSSTAATLWALWSWPLEFSGWQTAQAEEQLGTVAAAGEIYFSVPLRAMALRFEIRNDDVLADALISVVYHASRRS